MLCTACWAGTFSRYAFLFSVYKGGKFIYSSIYVWKHIGYINHLNTETYNLICFN